MYHSLFSISIIVTTTAVLFSCQKVETAQTTTLKDESESIETDEVNPPSHKLKSEGEVIDFLSDAGFLIKINGKVMYREDQLSNTSPEDITNSIEVLSADDEKNKTIIFYLMVSGTNLKNVNNQRTFTQKNVTDENYLAFMDRMVKYLQRQDRPVIKQALLNTTVSLSVDQCIEYLQLIGYLSRTAASSFSYNPIALKPLPIYFKLALLNKLKNTDDQGSMVFDQLKQDLGISS